MGCTVGVAMGHTGIKTPRCSKRFAKDGELYGVNKLGVEHLNPFFTGGVLFDIQSIKGRRMNKGEEIKVKDLQKALKAQNISESDIKPG